VYVLVLGVSTIVAAAGIATVSMARAGVRATAADRDAAEAGTAARAGLELLLAQINSTPAWRTACASGATIGPVTIGRAKVMMTITDETDGNLADDASQAVRLYAAARVGTCTRAMSVQAVPSAPVGYDALRCAIHAEGGVSITGTFPVSGGTVSSNASFSLNGASSVLTGNVEAPSVSSAGFIAGSVKTSGVTKTTPSGAAAWNALSAQAVTIPYSSLSPAGKIERDILAPALNMISTTTSPTGVYAITVPALATLTIHRSRLQCTLLVTLGLGAKLIIQDETMWDPPSPTMPSLLVQGDPTGSVTFKASPKDCKESDVGFNMSLNPPGVPYNGVENTTKLESYPNELHGLFHVMTATPVILDTSLSIVGCLIAGGTVSCNDPNCKAAATPSLLSAPPVGYADPTKYTVVPVAGSARWEVTR
jgi:hypothetical protein